MSTEGTAPAELADLRARMAELADLRGALTLLTWDQGTHMPPGGAATRGDQLATLERLAHERLVDPELGRLLDRLEPRLDGSDPDSDEVRLLRCVRRDHEKAARVPGSLAADMARASALGQAAWLEARGARDFARFRDALAVQLELRHHYAACFPEAAHPYDVLLDDYEPGLTAAELRPLFDELEAALAPLVDAAAEEGQSRNAGVFAGPFDEEAQRVAVVAVLAEMGYDHRSWRLDRAPHPFAQSPGPGDYRITTRYRADDFAVAFYSALHEFGHGLYDAGLDPSLAGTPLHAPVSLGVHESQSRLWENVVGRGRPFCEWLLPRLRRLLPGAFDAVGTDALYRSVNTVQRSLVRTDADETTYNLHIALRLDLELRMIESTLAVDDLPAAFDEGSLRLLGVAAADPVQGVLQDVHWAQGAFGYFPTYTLGNLMAAQLWAQALEDVPDLEEAIGRGEFGVLREWLRERVHRHGRKFGPRELLARATGQELVVGPFVAYLRGKLLDAGVLRSETPAG